MKLFFKILLSSLCVLTFNPLLGSVNKVSNLNIAYKKSPLVQKKFVFVVRSYNNADYCEKNLTSILTQNYENYRVIYIDDVSKDATYEMVKAIIERFHAQDKVTLIHNEINRKGAYNLYTAAHSCANDEIICIVDGDDWLAHENVLQSLNTYYADENVWLTYGGQTVDYPTGKEGKFSKPISFKLLKEGSIKKLPWMTSHLRTFYAGLYKKVKLQDLLYNGTFVPVAEDFASMIPMIELAREHAYYIDEILYVYNTVNPLSLFTISDKQQFFIEYMRQLPVNQPLISHPAESCVLTEDDTSDLLIFSYNRPLQLYALLESVQKYAQNLGKVFVVYQTSDQTFEESYEVVKTAFPDVQYLSQENESAKKVFKPLVLEAVFDTTASTSKYITFASDDLVLKDIIDFRKSALLLEKYQAYAFFFRLGTNINYSYMTGRIIGIPHPLLKLEEDVFAWHFTKGKGEWRYPNNIDLTLYRKKDLFPVFQRIDFSSPNDFESNWQRKAKFNQIGLCCEVSKMVDLPLNSVSNYKKKCSKSYSVEILHELFVDGKKINIDSIHDLQNYSTQIDFDPGFLDR